MPPLFDKGEVSRSDGGDKKAIFRYSKFEVQESIRKKGVTCYALFALVKNGNKVKRAATPRERKETGSQPHGVSKVGVLYKSFRRLSLNFFSEKI